ncbi:MAG: ATP-binding protein [Lachnospiraceae bacterium]|nr:ATP-binding protein [Lachnospiraceae bacterium]
MNSANPFTLTFGKEPALQIERYENTNQITESFSSDHPVSQTFLIEGIRGSGKTVLMTTVSKKLAEDNRWIIVHLNPAMNLLSDFALRLEEVCRKVPRLLRKGFQLSVGGVGLGVGGESDVSDPVGAINAILKQLREKKKRVLITIDEVQHDQNMRIFASQFQIFLREDYPIFLIMTGLYEKISAIQNDPALTFLLRTPKIRLEPLSMFQIRKKYRDVFALDDETAASMSTLTRGYAFAFQAFGNVYWEMRDKADMDEILSKLDDMLDDFVYRKIWDSLTGKERDIILAMSEGETRTGDICNVISMTSGSFSQYRDNLIRRGILFSPRHGYVSLTLPRFSLISKKYVLS